MNLRSTVKKVIPRDTFRKIEPYGHLAEAVLQNTRYGFPARGLKVIGVTGTDGKTSTCTLITAMLRDSGYKVAMMTTISVDYGDGKGARPNPSRMTTMGVGSLLSKIKKIKASGAEWLVLETTSHALAQHRVWAVPYSVAVMTNLGHEHLDYHGTFERYRAAKRMLFTQTDRNHQGLRVGVANADDPNGSLFASATTHPLLYGVKHGDLRARDIKLTPSGSTYTATIGDDTYHITCHLPGSFNVYNSLAAVGVGRALGLTPKQIEQGIASLDSVEGRMTRVDEGQDFAVIVDYAHTPESFEKLFKEVRTLTKGRLIVVFGSAGRRDEAKRAMQGRVAGRDADVVIVTEEDDRDEDGQAILEQIAAGAKENGKTQGKDLFLVHQREDAVQAAVAMAKKGDIVLLLGKGHEKSILTNGPRAAELHHLQQDDTNPERVVRRDYDEVTVARRTLKARHKK
ncbi:MAG TPA: UDP-N-acetylmuramoyl-L-alanyl-D-glutamate--2,6-diaminopimelate ligase [Candidatus Saccharimonadales bacterium]|nr:UDP-N-acetylmuramoyl-L-alanyl-D-glutamate--2,6-diaminopimelate ligase [Candidatus Saccharimonadales bacterium]